MIADLPPEPPAIVQQIPARSVIAWGDLEALDAMRLRMEELGWTWATLEFGEGSPALYLEPPPKVTDAQVTDFINRINRGEFGRISAGYGMIGDTDDA